MEGSITVSDIEEIKCEVREIKGKVHSIHEALLGRLTNGQPGLIQRVDNLTMQTRWQWAAICAILLGLLGVFLGK